MYDQDTFEHSGCTFRVTFEADDSCDAPWDREDGHGPVSEWKHHAFGMGSKPPKAPGERILVWERGSYRTYDYAEAMRIAKQDGWDAAPYGGTKGERAARAVEADFKRLQAWCNDEWSYVGIIVTLVNEDGEDMGESASLWGVESDCASYVEEVARELADDIIHNVNSALRAA